MIWSHINKEGKMSYVLASCQSCRFWKPGSTSTGECRYSPPVWIAGTLCRFPATGAYDWCGQFAVIWEPPEELK
jgi:hypothetical protein